MNIVYFLSPRHPYETVIYSGVGPRYAQIFGWPTASLETIAKADCDIGIIDNRLMNTDLDLIDVFLAQRQRRFPIFFKLSDPDMPTYREEVTRYIFRQANVPGVHYISIYDPEGPLQDFMATLSRSHVLRLPFPYDAKQEVECEFDDRRRAVFLSGSADPRPLYPLRSRLRRQIWVNPLLRLVVTDLPHPGYPERGEAPRHDLVFERFVRRAAQYSHFFLCPTRYRSELMKFVECAYAGCVPIGEAPNSLKDHVGRCFISYSGHPMQLFKSVMSTRGEMQARAAEYRSIVRTLRDPARLVASFKEQILDVALL
jgi:hypothetical protein